MDVLFIGFPGIHLSHEMQVLLDYTSHTCLDLHVYNDEKQVLFEGDFARENFAVTFLRGFWPPTAYPTLSGPYW